MDAAKATEAIQTVAAKFKINAQSIVVGLVVAVAVSFVVAYILYYFAQSKMLNKVPYVFKETGNPRLGTELSKFYAGGMPGLENGRRMSFSFWIYIHDINKYKGVLRHVMHLGESDLLTASPVVFLGPDDNKLYVAMNPNKVIAYPTGVTTVPQKMMYIAKKHGLVFDYIPIQRWVHVGVVINESVNNGSITGFLDGEIVKTVTTGMSVSPIATLSIPQTTDTTVFQNLLLDKRGNLFIGGSMSEPDIGPGFSGLVASVKFYNHDLNVKDMYNDYRGGPIGGGFLGKLGQKLGYGVRAPLYKIGDGN